MDFKKLSEVAKVEEVSDESCVLVEEDGVIKRAPKTAVGGSGGGSAKADLVIRINNRIENATIEDIEIISGSVEAVYTLFESGTFPVVEVEFLVTMAMNSYERGANKFPAKVIFYGDSMYISFIGVGTFLNPYVCQIRYDSANNYALSGFSRKTITTLD